MTQHFVYNITLQEFQTGHSVVKLLSPRIQLGEVSQMDVVKVLLFTALFLCWTSQVLSQSVSVSAAQLGEWRSCMLVQPSVPVLDRV